MQKIGILRESGQEHFKESLLIPVFSLEGDVLGMYGREIHPTCAKGTISATPAPRRVEREAHCWL